MDEIELIIHTDGAELRHARFPGSVTVEEIIVATFPDGHQDLLLFVEEEAEPKARHHRLHESGIHHGHHVHIRHRHHHRPHHHHAPPQVEITINGVKHETHRGSNEVEHLRKLGHVPAPDILAEFNGGQFHDLDDHARVEIRGGELFASHVKSAGSS